MIKEKIIKIQDGDNLLTFKVRKMGAIQGAEWMAKAGFLLGKRPDMMQSMQSAASATQAMGPAPSGAQPEASEPAKTNGEDMIMAAVMFLAMNSQYEDCRPLFMELLGCCSRIDAGVEQVCTPDTVEAFIEDPMTIFKLIKEAGAWNFSSLLGGNQPSPSSDDSGPARSRRSSPTIRTSRGSSEQ